MASNFVVHVENFSLSTGPGPRPFPTQPLDRPFSNSDAKCLQGTAAVLGEWESYREQARRFTVFEFCHIAAKGKASPASPPMLFRVVFRVSQERVVHYLSRWCFNKRNLTGTDYCSTVCCQIRFRVSREPAVSLLLALQLALQLAISANRHANITYYPDDLVPNLMHDVSTN